MALYLSHTSDGANLVTAQNPIQTRHSSNGEADVIPLYLFNDGKRTNADDTTIQALRYTNIKIKIEGVSYKLADTLDMNVNDTTLIVDVPVGETLKWNVGTVLLINSSTGVYQGERLYVEKLLSTNSVQVRRNYTTNMPVGTTSTLKEHRFTNNLTVVAETASVSLRLPYVDDYTTEPAENDFQTGGLPLDLGLDPTRLTVNITDPNANIIYCSNGLRYKVDSLIKVDNEVMKVVGSTADSIQVVRGYGSMATTHEAINTTTGKQTYIYNVGLVDTLADGVTHKFYLKNDPPANLPTQKKQDIRIVIEADEEPL